MVFKVLFINLITNLVLSIIKIIGGLLGNSKTLFSEGVHSLTDLSSNIVCLIAMRLTKIPENKKHPYGHGKYEYIASIFISISIMTLSVLNFINVLTKKATIPSTYVLLILMFTFIVKLILSYYTVRVSKKINSSVLLSTGLESKMDALNSIIALVFVFITRVQTVKLFAYGDKIGGLIISLVIFKVGFKLLKDNIGSLIGEVETNKIYISEVKDILTNYKSIKKVKDVKLIKYGSYYIVELKIQVSSNRSIGYLQKLESNIIKKIKQKEIYKFVNISFTI